MAEAEITRDVNSYADSDSDTELNNVVLNSIDSNNSTQKVK